MIAIVGGKKPDVFILYRQTKLLWHIIWFDRASCGNKIYNTCEYSSWLLNKVSLLSI